MTEEERKDIVVVLNYIKENVDMDGVPPDFGVAVNRLSEVMAPSTNAVDILRRRYGNPSVEVRAEMARDDAEEKQRYLNSRGICGRCGGTFPVCCSCPDGSHWNGRLP